MINRIRDWWWDLDICITCDKPSVVCDLKHLLKDIGLGIAQGMLVGCSIGGMWALVHNLFFSTVG